MLLSSANKVRAADRRDDPRYTVGEGIARMIGKQGMTNRIVILEEEEKKALERWVKGDSGLRIGRERLSVCAGDDAGSPNQLSQFPSQKPGKIVQLECPHLEEVPSSLKGWSAQAVWRSISSRRQRWRWLCIRGTGVKEVWTAQPKGICFLRLFNVHLYKLK